MRNIKTSGLLVLLALTGFAVLMGCTGEGAGSGSEREGNNVNPQEPGTFPGLDAETERRILQDYVDRDKGKSGYTGSIENIGIGRYFGTYNGCVVVALNGLATADGLAPDFIGGFRFPRFIMAWKDGQIHGLRDAYNMGLLTQDDLRSIAAYFPESMSDNS